MLIEHMEYEPKINNAIASYTLRMLFIWNVGLFKSTTGVARK